MIALSFLGGKSSKSSRRRRWRPVLDTLEVRAVPAVAMVGDEVRIIGNDNANSLTVRLRASDPSILEASDGFQTLSVNAASVNRLLVVGAGGIDTFTIDQTNGSPIPADPSAAKSASLFDGGPGTDTIELIQGVGVTQVRLSDTRLKDFVMLTFQGNTFPSTMGDSFDLSSVERATLAGGTGDNSLLADAFTGLVTLTGGSGRDVLKGGAANDVINGGNGNDRLEGGGGNDTLDGGANNDTLVGGTGNDTLRGSLNNDTYVFAPAAVAEFDRIEESTAAQGGSDLLDFSQLASDDPVSVNLSQFIDGFAQHTNRLVQRVGGAAVEQALGGAGNDDLNADLGGTTLMGGPGNDVIFGQRTSTLNLSQLLDGGPGNDRLDGGLGSDTLNGGEGNDTLGGGSGSDTFNDGPGNDEVFGFPGTTEPDTWNYFATDVAELISIRRARPELPPNSPSAQDLLLERRVNGELVESDLVRNVDLLNVRAQGGNDEIDFTGFDTGSFALGVTLDGGAGADLIRGGARSETMRGGTEADTLLGGGGNDSLFGGNGNDSLVGGTGSDFLDGEAGTDFLNALDGEVDQFRFVFTDQDQIDADDFDQQV